MLGFGAVAGVALAHVLDYLVVLTAPARRAEILAETGHTWHHVQALGGVAGLLALVGAFWCGLHQRSGSSRRSARPGPLLVDMRSVAILQMVLFGALETAERMLAHEALADLLRSRLFVVGLMLQMVVACVVAAVLRVAEHAAARLSAGSPPATCSPSCGLHDFVSVLFSLASGDRPDCRGPPSRLLRWA